MTNFVVLGGGGAFGLTTALYLLHQGHTVTAVGRNKLPPAPWRLNIDDYDHFRYYAYHATYEWDLLMRLLDKVQPDVIVNFAAQGEGAVSWRDSWRFFETNSMGLARLFEEIQERAWPTHFIQIGTSEMYGSVHAPAAEDAPIKPSSPYAASKVAFDLYLLSMWRVKQYPMTIIRPSNAYCRGQLLHRIIPRTFLAGLTGEKLPLQGGGQAEKSYIHARDLARAILMVAERPDITRGRVYNVGPDDPTKIKDLVDQCAGIMGMKPGQLYDVVGDRPGQDSRYWLDCRAIQRDLGWVQRIGLAEGLLEVYTWMEANIDELRKYPVDYTLRG